ncbi:helix-turn-helix transcriptional regulator [Granulicoccus sp. GXG6511]|uniref:helix-turn-helix transcriptional regulator n=1 Tax=Granulicoccus sp. GXG6511 TaxID=3381351 RepID=UPI003D7D8311
MGPRPVAEPALRLSAARAAVLAYLVELGQPVTVQSVSQSSGQHPNTVREHLEALVDMGFVSREALPPEGRGRPAIAYTVRAESSPLRSTREYAALVDALVEQLKATSRNLEADSLAVGERWAADVKSGEPLIEVLQRMGFEPVQESPHSLLLETCPVLAAAHHNPDAVCTMHQGFLRAISDQDVELEPFVNGGCRLHLTKPSTPEESNGDRPD